MSKTHVLSISSRRIQFLDQAHKGCVPLDVSRMPLVILSVVSYSWSSEKKRVRLRVRPWYLLQSRLSKDERSSSTGSLFSLIFSFWKLCLLANLDALKMLLDYAFCGTPRRKSERALYLFFVLFSADWRKSMRAHNEKHRKKLAWPKRGLAVRFSAMNHVRVSGSVFRWPRGVSCALFVSWERSRDRSAESFLSSFGEFAWFHNVGGMHFEDTGMKAREMHRNAACFEPPSKLIFSVVHERGSKSNHGTRTPAWSGAMCFTVNHV